MRKLTLLALMVVIVGAGLILAVDAFKKHEPVYVPETNNQLIYDKGFSGAAEWIYNRQANAETGLIRTEAIEMALKQIGRLQGTKNSLNLEWEFMGPSNIGGRCRAIQIDKSNPDIIYAGGVSGGLWKSTTGGTSWFQVKYAGDAETGLIPNLNVASVCQTANGHVYFGTGEYFANPYGTQNTGFQGAGIWKSTDGETFTRIPSTWSTTESKNTFVFVNRMVAHPTIPDKIFAATKRGLQVSDDGGETWTNPILNIAGFPINETCGTVAISEDGSYLIVDLGVNVYVSHENGDVGTWVKVTGTDATQLPTSSIRTELAIAPSNKDVMYAMLTKNDRSLLNVYRSTDGGVTWSIIGPGGSTEFNPLGSQGDYNNVIAVYPDNENEIIVGGQYSLWKWGLSSGWEMLTFWSLPITSSTYVHADQHELKFHPTNPNIVYCGSDGGIHRSTTRGISWVTLNKNFGVTQFYAIGHDGTNKLIGGTQDNGTLYIDPDRLVTTGLQNEAVELPGGGDGGYSEISQICPSILFRTIYYGALYRSEDVGEEIHWFFDTRLTNSVNPGDKDAGHSFVTPIALWESFNDLNSIETRRYIANSDYEAGDTLYVESNIKEHYLVTILEEPLNQYDTLYVTDYLQSRFVIGFKGGVWMTKDALNFRVSPVWQPVAQLRNESTNYEVVQHLEWSADGAYLYFATNHIENGFFKGSILYRLGNFNEMRTDSMRDADFSTYTLDKSQIAVFSNRHITGIGVDPEFAGNVAVTLGNYDNSDYIYYSNSAHVAPHVTSGVGTFVSKQGNLPQMPVYDALIVWNDSRKVLVGTEFGVYATENIMAQNPVWTDENTNGLDYVPVYHLRQQTIKNGWMEDVGFDNGIRNHGYIWAGTHGRGIFRTKAYAGPVSIDPVVNTTVNSKLNLYPNPVIDQANVSFTLENSADAVLRIYDVKGSMIRSITMPGLDRGQHSHSLNLGDLKDGVYMMTLQSNGQKMTTRFIKR